MAFSPQNELDMLASLESELGRVRTLIESYESRNEPIPPEVELAMADVEARLDAILKAKPTLN